MELTELGSTGIHISPLGFGTVKLGRNEQVKYPHHFEIPDDRTVIDLLNLTRSLGINLIDTAPAYGSSQERLGQLLPGPRRDWVIASKVGEFFETGQSRFDFTYESTLKVIEQSLITLKTDYLDIALIHSDGNDLSILQNQGAVDALVDLKMRGLIRSHGISSKTIDGGIRATEQMDIVMATCNLKYNDELPVLQAAKKRGKGVLVKKGLQSGRTQDVSDAMRFIFSQPGVSSMIVGTINAEHLKSNVQCLNEILNEKSKLSQ